jgi:hypothetical protein
LKGGIAVTEKKRDAKNIIVMCEDCKVKMAMPKDEVPPTCYICGCRMLPVEEDQGVAG